MAEKRLTNCKIVILRSLEAGPQKWATLRVAYFGEARARLNKATTSFYNKCKDMEGDGLLEKNGQLDAYQLTTKGTEMIQLARTQMGDEA
ncbi:MAG: hypothetical protein ABSA33_06255, partial [Candidatus Micrarchaeaceae archaeon]